MTQRFHQLGCLAAFRKAIQEAGEGIMPGMDYKDNSQWPFCLDYMRKVSSPNPCHPLGYALFLIYSLTRLFSAGRMIQSSGKVVTQIVAFLAVSMEQRIFDNVAITES